MVELQFALSDGVEGWAIRMYDHGRWSHVDAVMADGWLLGARDDEVGGKPSGVQVRPAGYRQFAATKRVSIPATEQQTQDFQSFLIAQVGKPYDQTAICGFVFDRDWRDPEAWFCSELQGAALETAKVFGHELATPTDKLTPSGLYLAVSVLVDVTDPGPEPRSGLGMRSAKKPSKRSIRFCTPCP